MTANSRKKFLFDTDFSEEDVAPVSVQGQSADVKAEETAEPPAAEEVIEVEEAPPPPTYSEEELAQAREEGMRAGRDEATRDMTSALEQRLVNTMDTINAQIATLFDTYDQDKEEHSRDAVAVAAVIVRKLFPAMNMDKAMNEIEHVISEAMKRTSGTPTLIIRAPQDMKREIEDKAVQLSVLRGREGTLSVIVDENMAVGDIAVEWEGGGMIRDTRFIWSEIDEIIERNLGKNLDDYAPTQVEDGSELELDAAPATQPKLEAEPETDQLVVNPAKVGENEEIQAESPQTESDSAPTDEPAS